MLSIRWTRQQEVHHYAGWSIPGPRPLYAHIQEGNALVQGAELLKPARKCDVCSSLGAKPCARCKNTFYCSLPCMKSAWKKHKKTCKEPTSPPTTEADGLNFDQLSLVVLHVLDERASGVVGAVDLVVLGGEGLSEEGGEGGGGDVVGGEPEDLYDLFARIELGELCPLEGCFRVNCVFICKGKWAPIDHSKSKKHEGVAVCLAIASKLSKKFRIVVFEHFTHQLVIVLVDPLVTVCPRS